jgi:hypothetical protein
MGTDGVFIFECSCSNMIVPYIDKNIQRGKKHEPAASPVTQPHPYYSAEQHNHTSIYRL